MARSILRSSGNRTVIPTVAAPHTVGDLVVERRMVGMVETTVALGATTTIIIAGAIGLITVPVGMNQGDPVYATGASPIAAGTLLANQNAAAGLSATATGNTLIGQLLDQPTGANQSRILLYPQSGPK